MSTSNIEIKAKCADLARARGVAERLGARCVGCDHQLDTYFASPRGRLKLRESSISGAQLIPYLRPDANKPKRSDYLVVPVEEPAKLKQLLGEMFGVSSVVDKTRRIYLLDNVRIHLDEVKGLGAFIEFEAVFDGSSGAAEENESRVNELIQAFGIRSEDLVAGSYSDLSSS